MDSIYEGMMKNKTKTVKIATASDWRTRISEAGDMHSPDCPANSEEGCDAGIGLLDCCDNMRFIAKEIAAATAQENARCVGIVEEISNVSRTYGYGCEHTTSTCDDIIKAITSHHEKLCQ